MTFQILYVDGYTTIYTYTMEVEVAVSSEILVLHPS